MDFRALGAILLFSFAIPVVMQYRILPIEGTPYWLFGLLFFALIGYGFLSIYRKVPMLRLKGKKNLKESGLAGDTVTEKTRFFLLWFCVAVTIGGVTITAIADRHRVAPIWGVHDIILQQEQAIRFFLTGKNPYQETYFGTPVAMFHYDEQGQTAVNPALYHFVMPPWYLLFPLPVYWSANRLFGYFDGRMALLLLLAGTLLALWFSFRRRDIREVAIILFSLSPATVNYFVEGRSDAFALFWLVASMFLLSKRRTVLSAVFFALGVLSKQTMWFALPLYFFFLYLQNRKSLQALVAPILTFALVSAIVALPFILWNPSAFLDSVVLYLSAGGPKGYPVSGYGLSMILYSAHIMKGLHDYYPFIIWQMAAGIPAIAFAAWFIRKKPVLSRFYLGYTVVLFAFWYTSRYFNNSHIAFIATLLSLGVLFHYDEEDVESTKITGNHQTKRS